LKNITGQIYEKLAILKEWRRLLEDNGFTVLNVSRDKGSDIFKNLNPLRIIARLLLEILLVMPLPLAYQFVFICEKK